MFRRSRGPKFDLPADDTGADSSARGGARTWPHLLFLALVCSGFLAAVRLTSGQAMFEKVLQALLAPCGLVWLGLIVLLYIVVIRSQKLAALSVLVILVVYTAAGNSFVASRLIRSLEEPFAEHDWRTVEPYDVVLVLGGGTATTPYGSAQASMAGDRVVLAGRMYHQGKIDTLVCSGSGRLFLAPGELTGSEAAFRILTDLQVPARDIVQLPGANTFEEIRNFADWLQLQPAARRVGILTSAWHLRRAMSLAGAMGVDAEPIAADFQSRPFRPEPHLLVPGAQNLSATGRVLKEYLATLIGR